MPATRTRGLTLIELMIVLVVISVLVALAYPSFVDYVRKARRGEAQQLLLNWAINQEIFRSNNTTYAAANNVNLPAPDHDYYAFTAASISATTYTLRATASGDQAKDKSRTGAVGECATLEINQAGTKTPAACWD
jgi:type IV pilus assembly protein PilE